MEVVDVDDPVPWNDDELTLSDHPNHFLRGRKRAVKNSERERNLSKLRHLALLQRKGVGLEPGANGTDLGAADGSLGEGVGERGWLLAGPVPVREPVGRIRNGKFRNVSVGGVDKKWLARIPLLHSEFTKLVWLAESLGIKPYKYGPKSLNGKVTGLVRAIAQGKLSVSWNMNLDGDGPP